MSRVDDERFFSMAEVYDRMVQTLVPNYDFLQDEMIKTLRISEFSRPVVVDLGGGSGIFLEKILKANPTAFCYWIDYSEDFLKVAQKRLSPYKDRVQLHLIPLEDSWESLIDREVNFIVSMSVIHHFENHEKKALYERGFHLLKNGGWLVNIDEMKTLYDDAYMNSLYYWLQHVKDAQSSLSEGERDFYDEWNVYFERWKIRNVDKIHEIKRKGDDLHEDFVLQLKWFKEIGYQNVDLFLKVHLWCAIGGQKNKNY